MRLGIELETERQDSRRVPRLGSGGPPEGAAELRTTITSSRDLLTRSHSKENPGVFEVSTEKQADRSVSLDAQRAKVKAYLELYELS